MSFEYNKEKGMNTLEKATEWADSMEYPLLCVGGDDGERMKFANAFLGVTNEEPPRAVYSEEKVVDAFIKHDGMTWEEAVEYFEFNVRGAYMGEQTPLFIMSFESY